MTAHAGSADRVVCAPSDRRPAVLDTIRAARRRLSLSLFRCDDQEVLDALADAVRRGVHVRALITSRAKGSKKLLTQLEDYLRTVGVEVRRYSDRVVRYHAKYIVADDGPALIASLNFTEKCFTHTCDFVLVTRDQGLVAGLNDLFMADWDGVPPGTRPSTTDRLIVGPEQARSRFGTLLTQAVSRIRLIDPKLDDPAMLALLKARASAGVEVDIRGAEDMGTLVPHGKLLLIDDSTAVIGSISLSILALEFRRELAVVTHDRESLTTLEEFWLSLPRRLPEPARIA